MPKVPKTLLDKIIVDKALDRASRLRNQMLERGMTPSEFITDVLQPDPSMDMSYEYLRRPNRPAPRMQLNRLKTNEEPIPFDDIEGFSKSRPYWLWLEGGK